MMNEKDVVDLLEKAERIGAEVWIAGGWGVDALVGRQSRPHNDLDIFLQKKDATVFIEMLLSNGFCKTGIEEIDNTVWSDSHDRIVDLHLFEFAEADTWLFQSKYYPLDVWSGKGTIGGISVHCFTAEAQVPYHQGYERRDKDIHDVRLLCETFGLSIPEEF
jgi:lincosamide nucleotidyltransferase A/C/D/E